MIEFGNEFRWKGAEEIRALVAVIVSSGRQSGGGVLGFGKFARRGEYGGLRYPLGSVGKLERGHGVRGRRARFMGAGLEGSGKSTVFGDGSDKGLEVGVGLGLGWATFSPNDDFHVVCEGGVANGKRGAGDYDLEQSQGVGIDGGIGRIGFFGAVQGCSGGGIVFGLLVGAGWAPARGESGDVGSGARAFFPHGAVFAAGFETAFVEAVN